MSEIAVGQAVPDFTLPATGEQAISLSQFRDSKHVVLYFYPKDNTSGCTSEAEDFRELNADFAAQDAVILGISRDGIKSHENFKAKLELPFELLSDKDETVCQLFDVIKPKVMYGKESLGVERSTFLIDKAGVLRQEWRKVKVEGHAQAVLDALRAL